MCSTHRKHPKSLGRYYNSVASRDRDAKRIAQEVGLTDWGQNSGGDIT